MTDVEYPMHLTQNELARILFLLTEDAYRHHRIARTATHEHTQLNAHSDQESCLELAEKLSQHVHNDHHYALAHVETTATYLRREQPSTPENEK